jgi:hypothetical protein
MDDGPVGYVLLVVVLGAGFAFGGTLGRWRYGRGLGEGMERFFRAAQKWGAVVSVASLFVLGVVALVR